MPVPVQSIPSRIDPFTGLPVVDQQPFAKDGQTMVVGMLSRFHDAAGPAQQPAQAPTRVYTYADACMGLGAVQAAPGSFSDADLKREAAYAQRKAEIGNFELQSGEVGSIQGPATSLVELQARAAVAAVERDQRISNAWRNEEDV